MDFIHVGFPLNHIPSMFRTHLHLHFAWELSPKQYSSENRRALDRNSLSLQTSKATSYSLSACLHRLSSLEPVVDDSLSFVSPSCSPVHLQFHATFTHLSLYFAIFSHTHPYLQLRYLSEAFLCTTILFVYQTSCLSTTTYIPLLSLLLYVTSCLHLLTEASTNLILNKQARCWTLSFTKISKSRH
jgi:hypothetical protein